MAVVTMRQMLESGVHFGHQTRRWNPKMKRFILTERNGIYIVDLAVDPDLHRPRLQLRQGHGRTRRDGALRRHQEAGPGAGRRAGRAGRHALRQPAVAGRDAHQLRRPSTSDPAAESPRKSTSTTSPAPASPRRSCSSCAARRTSSPARLGGIRDMNKLPSAVWIVDTNKEHLAVDEARKLGVPVVAILDTNCDPDLVDYAIPGNDDAIRAVTLLTRVVADAVADGLLARHSAPSPPRRAPRAPRRSRWPSGSASPWPVARLRLLPRFLLRRLRCALRPRPRLRRLRLRRLRLRLQPRPRLERLRLGGPG